MKDIEKNYKRIVHVALNNFIVVNTEDTVYVFNIVIV